jgi:hypothetical protein
MFTEMGTVPDDLALVLFLFHHIMATAPKELIKSKAMPGAQVKATTEAVSGGTLLLGHGTGPRTLPSTIDDVEREVGHRVYDRMVTDPDVSAGLDFLCLACWSDGLTATPAIDDDSNPQHAHAKELADFINSNMARVPNIIQKLKQCTRESLSHGNKVAEKLFEYPERGPLAGKLCLKDFKPKPREVIGFVVDEFMNTLGLVAIRPGQALGTLTVVRPEDILPLEKFYLLTPLPKDGNPQGEVYIRAAYYSWWLKLETYPELLRAILQFALASLMGFLPADAEDVEIKNPETGQPILDPITQKPITLPAAQDMLNALVSIRNAQAAVFDHDAKVQQIESKSTGRIFFDALTYYGKQITLAILKQELATRDAEHQTKGSTGEQQGILHLVIQWLKFVNGESVRHFIWKDLIRWNYGDEDAEELLPLANMGDYNRKDWSAEAEAVARLAPILADSQLLQLLNEIGIDSPEEGETLPARGVKAAPAPGGNPDQPGQPGQNPDQNNGGQPPQEGN